MAPRGVISIGMDTDLSRILVPPNDFAVEGRGNLESWFALHYIAHDHVDDKAAGPHSRTVSRTLEYAYDDFCIATLADRIGRKADAKKYMERSGYWKNVWNPHQRDIYQDENGDYRITKYKGFMMPRGIDGKFKYQNTRTCSPSHDTHMCYFDTLQSTYEGSPWLYSFFVPQDMAGLIQAYGGREAFIERLDFFHSSGIAYMGNEQAFLTVFQFHYGGRPGLSSSWVHKYIPAQFNATVNGIPGNDDCAMGAFSSLAMMGFFPVAGQDVYLIIPPFFPEVRIRSRGPKPAIIRKILAPPAGAEDGSKGKAPIKENWDDAIYIQSATLDGKPYARNWISHDIFLNGGVLELVVGPKESRWGTREEDLPPSWPASTPTLKHNDP
jgi:putative alpha-1,2-mannosidase